MSYLRRKLNDSRISKLDKESLSEHEEMMLFGARNDEKRFIFDEMFHVPIIFAGPGIPANLIIDNQIGSVDIFPTISEIIQLDEKPDFLDGISVLPLIRGETIPKRPIYMVSTTIREDTDIVVGIRTENYKYSRLYSDSKKQVHLYDLKNDPFEITNISDSNPNIILEMENKLKSFEINNINEKTTKMDPDEIDKVKAELKKLGYI